MKNFIRSFLLIFLFALLAVSCSDNKFAGFERGENNVHYKVHQKSGDTAKPVLTDWVTVNMDYRLSDTILFSSKNLEKPLRFSMIEPMFEGDLYEGIKLMSVGDSMTFAVVADSFYFKTAFAKNLPDFVEPGSLLYYDVKLVDLASNAEFMKEMEQEKEALKENEQKTLGEYIQQNNIAEKPLKSGLYFIPVKKGNGPKPDTGDMCSVFLEVKEIGGELLFTNFEGDPIDVEYGKNFDTKGFMQGLGMLNEGGRARMIVPSSIGVGEKGREVVEPFTTILYDVELLEIKTIEEVKRERKQKKAAEEAEKDTLKGKESSKLQAYIQEKNIKVAPSSKGLYFITIEEGNGTKPKLGETIKLYYTVSRTDGKLIYDSHEKEEPIEFELGNAMVVKAWEEAIPKMRRGGKYLLITPSSLAYGRKGQGKDIGPYQPLVYEIDLLENN